MRTVRIHVGQREVGEKDAEDVHTMNQEEFFIHLPQPPIGNAGSASEILAYSSSEIVCF